MKPGLFVARAALVFFALSVAFSLIVHLTAPILPEDDGFIIYRYVDNLIAGRGLVYNPGERVFGVSTPLFLAVLAIAKAALPAVPTPDIAVRGNALSYLAFAFGLLLLLRRLLGPTTGTVAAGLIALRFDLLRASLGGMESLLFSALVVWTLWALSRSSFPLAGLLAGLSILARPEGATLVLLTAGCWLVAGRPKPLLTLIGLLLPGCIWLILGTTLYGTPVYHSLIAKARPLYPLPPGYGLWRILRELEFRLLGNPAVGGAPSRLPFSVLSIAAIVLSVAALTATVIRPRSAGNDSVLRRLIPTTPAILLLLLFVFYLFTNPLVFPWYYPPLFVLFSVVLLNGLARLRLLLPRTGNFWPAAALVLAALWGLRGPAGNLVAGRGVFDTGIQTDPVRLRVLAYREAALWLNRIVPDDHQRVAAAEVGALGYYYRGPLIDACGLVSPEALPFLPAPDSERASPRDGVIPTGLVQRLQPPLVVTIATFARYSIYRDPWFGENYSLIRQFPLPMPLWGSTAVDVFLRNDLLAEEQ